MTIDRVRVRRASNHSTPRHSLSDTRRRTVRVSFKVRGFKPQPDPYKSKAKEKEDEHTTFRMRAAATSLPNELLSWMDVNPREQSLSGPVINAMTETWDESPHEFYRCNRGILVFARSLEYDAATETVTLVFDDPRMHGVGDGGHTLRHVLENLVPGLALTPDETNSQSDDDDEESRTAPVERYIEVEVITGLELPEISRIAKARNTSKNVPEYAIKNLEGKYDGLYLALKKVNKTYADKVVAFKPNEHIEGSQEFKPVSILTVLQILTCMDITTHDEDNHPIEAYKNRGKTPEFFANREAAYEALYPIIGDLLGLYDRIRLRVPEAYNAKGKRWGRVIKEPVGRGIKEELYYRDPTGETTAPKAPAALFFPMLSAFRAALRIDGEKYAWLDDAPLNWNDDEFDEVVARLAVKIAKAVRSRGDDFHVVGRDNEVWGNCYSVVKEHLLETGRMPTRGRKR